MNCALNDSDVAPGCNGGEPWYIFKLMADRSMPDETCQPYQARNMECNPLCTNCDAALGTCFPLKSFVGYKVEEYGRVTGEKNMMKEIYERGPITCSYAATDEFVYNYTANTNANAGVFVDDTQYSPDKVRQPSPLPLSPSLPLSPPSLSVFCRLTPSLSFCAFALIRRWITTLKSLDGT